MIAAGHDVFAHARSGLLAHMERGGTRQADLVARSGLTKQAVQQFVDELVADGIVERIRDPDDGRGRIVVFTRAAAGCWPTPTRSSSGSRSVFAASSGRSASGSWSAALKDLGDRPAHRGCQRCAARASVPLVAGALSVRRNP